MDRDEVRFGEHAVEIGELDTEAPSALGANVGVEGDDPHAERRGPLRHQSSDLAHAKDTQGLSVELDAAERGAFPPSAPQAGIGLRHPPGLSQEQRHGVLGGRDGVGVRCIHHEHPVGRRRLDVDVVDPDSGPANDLQVRRGGDQIGIDDRCRADDQAGSAAHALEQCGAIGSDGDVDVTERSQRGNAGIGNGFRDHDLHVHSHLDTRMMPPSPGASVDHPSEEVGVGPFQRRSAGGRHEPLLQGGRRPIHPGLHHDRSVRVVEETGDGTGGDDLE